MKNWSVLVWLPLVIGLTLVGCGDDTDSESTETTTEEGGEAATEEGDEAATEEGDEAATEEGDEAATEEGGEAATEEGGEAGTEEGGEAATEEGGEAGTEEGGEAGTEEGGEAATEEGGEAGTEEGGEAGTEEGGEAGTEEGGEVAEEGGEVAEEGGEAGTEEGGEMVTEGGEAESSAFTCASIWHCELGCLEDDCACFEGSTGDDDPAVVAYDGLADCLKGECPLGEASCIGDEVTFIGECRAEAEVCVPDTAGGTCNDTVNCILMDCDVADMGCKEACFAGAKMENHVYGATYSACVEANCEFPYTEECLQKAKDDLCSTQWSACNNSDF